MPAPHTSKVARALGAGTAAEPPIDPDAPARDVLLAWASRQVGVLQALEAGVRADAPDAVHKARVATRRLRSLLKTFARLFDTARTDPLRAELRWLGAVLGEPRDAEVLREEFGDLLAELRDEAPEDVREGILGHLRAEHDRAHAALVAALDDEPTRPARCGRPWSSCWSTRRCVAGRAARPARCCRRPGTPRSRGGEAAPPGRGRPRDLERWHEVRKAAKAVRYATEAMADAVPGTDADVAAWEAVTEAFGELQDTAVASDLIAEVARRAARPPTRARACGGCCATRRPIVERPPSSRGAKRSRRCWTGPDQPSRAMGAKVAPVTAARSAGASSTCRPRLPPETYSRSKPSAEASMTVGSGVRWPRGEMPADDVARRALGRLRVGHLDLLHAQRGGERLEVEAPRDRHDADGQLPRPGADHQGLEHDGGVQAGLAGDLRPEAGGVVVVGVLDGLERDAGGGEGVGGGRTAGGLLLGPGHQRITATRATSSGAKHQRGQQVADGDVLELEQPDAQCHQQHAAGGRQRVDLRGGEQVAEQEGRQRQAALHDADGHGREHDAPAQRAGERDGGEAVQHRLHQELVSAAAQAVRQRAEDRQRPHAEQQRRGDDGVHEGAGVAGGGEARPQPGRRPTRAGPRSAAAEPTIAPNSSEPSTISMGAPGPTASVRAADDIESAEPTPRTNVMRPRTSVIVLLVRSGIRSPSSRPITAPAATVTTLATVPIPMNMTAIESPPWNSA